MKTRNHAVEGLRGIAFILVFLGHTSLLPTPFGMSRFTYFGCFAVTVFLMISGYLTGKKYLLDSPDAPCSILKLVKGRLSRIVPLHVITLLLAIPLAVSAKAMDLPRFLANLFLLQAWVPSMDYYYSFNALAWYLSVYLFLTLITPALIALLRKIRHRGSFAVLIVLTVFEAAWCALNSGSFAHAHYWVYVFPAARLADYLFGMELALVLQEERPVLNTVCRWGAIPLATLLLILSMFQFNFYFLASVWVIPAAMLLVLIHDPNKPGIPYGLFKSRLLVKLGEICFPMYLIHQLVMRYMTMIPGKLFSPFAIPVYVLVFAVSLGLAILYTALFGSRKRG